jgi:hypothetical protein
MGERGNNIGGIGSNGHGREQGADGDGRRFDELDALSDEDLKLLVGGVEDEEELEALADEAAERAPEDGEPVELVDDEARPRSHRASGERDMAGRRLFPDPEYESLPGTLAADEEGADALAPFEGGDGARTGIARARQLLLPVETALRAQGFYAYGTLDDQNRWTVAVDDEAGRVDVRLGTDGFVVDLRATSPGLYADVDHPFRRRRLERAAREHLPRIANGLLEPHQTAEWDEVDHGVAITVRYLVPYARADDVGRVVVQRLPELEDLLTLVEERVTE